MFPPPAAEQEPVTAGVIGHPEPKFTAPDADGHVE